MPKKVSFRKTFYKDVEVDLDESDIREILEEYADQINIPEGVAGTLLDALIARGAVMQLTPCMRYELLTGSRQLQSVMV